MMRPKETVAGLVLQGIMLTLIIVLTIALAFVLMLDTIRTGQPQSLREPIPPIPTIAPVEKPSKPTQDIVAMFVVDNEMGPTPPGVSYITIGDLKIGLIADGATITRRDAEANRKLYTVDQSSAIMQTSIDSLPPRELAKDRSNNQYAADGIVVDAYQATGAGPELWVVDSGIRHTHMAFDGAVSSQSPECSYEYPEDANGIRCIITDTRDVGGHGTAVASMAYGDYTGLIKGCEVHSVKVVHDGKSTYPSDILYGLSYIAEHGQPGDVINISLQGPHYATLDAAIQALLDQGFYVTLPAGNAREYTGAGRTSPYAENAVVAGSIKANDRIGFWNWYFRSGYGHSVDLKAVAEGGHWAASRGSDKAAGYHVLTGTSLAAPQAAGAILRYLYANYGSGPYPTPAVLEEQLRAMGTSHQVNSWSTNPYLGDQPVLFVPDDNVPRYETVDLLTYDNTGLVSQVPLTNTPAALRKAFVAMPFNTASEIHVETQAYNAENGWYWFTWRGHIVLLKEVVGGTVVGEGLTTRDITRWNTSYDGEPSVCDVNETDYCQPRAHDFFTIDGAQHEVVYIKRSRYEFKQNASGRWSLVHYIEDIQDTAYSRVGHKYKRLGPDAVAEFRFYNWHYEQVLYGRHWYLFDLKAHEFVAKINVTNIYPDVYGRITTFVNTGNLAASSGETRITVR